MVFSISADASNDDDEPEPAMKVKHFDRDTQPNRVYGDWIDFNWKSMRRWHSVLRYLEIKIRTGAFIIQLVTQFCAGIPASNLVRRMLVVVVVAISLAHVAAHRTAQLGVDESGGNVCSVWRSWAATRVAYSLVLLLLLASLVSYAHFFCLAF